MMWCTQNHSKLVIFFKDYLMANSQDEVKGIGNNLVIFYKSLFN